MPRPLSLFSPDAPLFTLALSLTPSAALPRQYTDVLPFLAAFSLPPCCLLFVVAVGLFQRHRHAVSSPPPCYVLAIVVLPPCCHGAASLPPLPPCSYCHHVALIARCVILGEYMVHTLFKSKGYSAEDGASTSVAAADAEMYNIPLPVHRVIFVPRMEEKSLPLQKWRTEKVPCDFCNEEAVVLVDEAK
ncbi:hypothetical protein Taro_032649 [Colocasia esculenta]|uniref:Uncharacterized protein n=1 Tax=Colocasia esculenta TaxID=4460 RepID=A0A843W6Q8_COLES|nr:hypothetical protein [Colocasia esculenta]